MPQLLDHCSAIEIPSGRPKILEVGQEFELIHQLGEHFTIEVQGQWLKVDGQYAAALGQTPVSSAALQENFSEELLWQKLKTCYDPEIPVNIVDLGLIYSAVATQSPDGLQVSIVMTLTSPTCGMGPVLVQEVQQKIAALIGVAKVTVDLCFEPAWDRSRLSDSAKLALGLL